MHFGFGDVNSTREGLIQQNPWKKQWQGNAKSKVIEMTSKKNYLSERTVATVLCWCCTLFLNSTNLHHFIRSKECNIQNRIRLNWPNFHNFISHSWESKQKCIIQNEYRYKKRIFKVNDSVQTLSVNVETSRSNGEERKTKIVYKSGKWWR